jgi:hypothetical protein
MFTTKSVLSTITAVLAVAKAVISFIDYLGKLKDKSAAKAT